MKFSTLAVAAGKVWVVDAADIAEEAVDLAPENWKVAKLELVVVGCWKKFAKGCFTDEISLVGNCGWLERPPGICWATPTVEPNRPLDVCLLPDEMLLFLLSPSNLNVTVLGNVVAGLLNELVSGLSTESLSSNDLFFPNSGSFIPPKLSVVAVLTSPLVILVVLLEETWVPNCSPLPVPNCCPTPVPNCNPLLVLFVPNCKPPPAPNFRPPLDPNCSTPLVSNCSLPLAVSTLLLVLTKGLMFYRKNTYKYI